MAQVFIAVEAMKIVAVIEFEPGLFISLAPLSTLSIKKFLCGLEVVMVRPHSAFEAQAETYPH